MQRPNRLKRSILDRPEFEPLAVSRATEELPTGSSFDSFMYSPCEWSHPPIKHHKVHHSKISYFFASNNRQQSLRATVPGNDPAPDQGVSNFLREDTGQRQPRQAGYAICVFILVREVSMHPKEDPTAVTAPPRDGLRESIRVSVRLVDAPRLIQRTHTPQRSAE